MIERLIISKEYIINVDQTSLHELYYRRKKCIAQSISNFLEIKIQKKLKTLKDSIDEIVSFCQHVFAVFITVMNA